MWTRLSIKKSKATYREFFILLSFLLKHSMCVWQRSLHSDIERNSLFVSYKWPGLHQKLLTGLKVLFMDMFRFSQFYFLFIFLSEMESERTKEFTVSVCPGTALWISTGFLSACQSFRYWQLILTFEAEEPGVSLFLAWTGPMLLSAVSTPPRLFWAQWLPLRSACDSLFISSLWGGPPSDTGVEALLVIPSDQLPSTALCTARENIWVLSMPLKLEN